MKGTTMPGTILTSSRQRSDAKSIAKFIPVDGDLKLKAAFPGTYETIEIPDSLSSLIKKLIFDIASGSQVSVTAIPEELSTTVAANHLGISRPTLMKLIEKGEINSFKVGTHTRIKFSDLSEYIINRKERQRESYLALSELEDRLEEAEGMGA